jgi:hypothetical protein
MKVRKFGANVRERGGMRGCVNYNFLPGIYNILYFLYGHQLRFAS